MIRALISFRIYKVKVRTSRIVYKCCAHFIGLIIQLVLRTDHPQCIYTHT